MRDIQQPDENPEEPSKSKKTGTLKKITNSRQNNYDKTYLLSKSSEKDDAKLCYGKKTGVKNKRRLGNMKYCLMSDDEDYEEEDYQEDEDY